MRVEADAMYARLLGGIRFGELERLRGSLARMHDNLGSEPLSLEIEPMPRVHARVCPSGGLMLR